MNDKDRRYEWGAWLVWIIPVIVIGVLISLARHRDGTIQIYNEACGNWWARRDIYTGRQGMNYLPHFTLLFSPFYALGMPLCSILWRVVSVLCLAWSLRRLIAIVSPQPCSRDFFWGSLFAMPVCLGAVKFGQANVPFAAITVLAVVLLMEQRWKSAGAALVAAIAIKPLGLVLVLLAMCGCRRVIVPVVVSGIVMLLVPFAFAPPEYALAQYTSLIDNMRDCSQAAVEHRFANLNSIFERLSINLPMPVVSVMNLLAALGTLVVWLFAARRFDEPERGLLLLSLATVYLMLFNPMNESNSFVIVAPAITAVAIRGRQTASNPTWTWSLAVLLVATWVLPEMIYSLDRHSRLWGKPLLAGIGFLVVMVARTRELMRANASGALPPESLHSGIQPQGCCR